MRHFKTKRKNNNIKMVNILFLFLLIILFYKVSNSIRIEENKVRSIALAAINLDYKEEKQQSVFQEEESIKKIYIYNSHQDEKYSFQKLNEYNIDNTVLFASYILSSFLGDISYVEERKVKEILNINNFSYSDSYKVSRMFMESAKEEYPSLEYYIDLHRDSSNYDITTCNIDGKNYAKIMFVIGLENENNINNIAFANKINDKLKEFNSCITRGILKKEGYGVNGVYNQDFSSNAILIEVGGQYNTIMEVTNTLEIFANSFLSVIGEQNE